MLPWRVGVWRSCQRRLLCFEARSSGKLQYSTGAVSHLEQFTYRPPPSPLKAPSLQRGWILSRDHDIPGSGLEILLLRLEQQQQEEDLSQAHQLRNSVEEDEYQYIVEGNGMGTKNLNKGPRSDSLLQEDQKKNQKEKPFPTKPRYMRGPDIDKNSFIRMYYISAMRVPAPECWDLTFELREHLLNWPRVNNIGRVLGDDVDEDLAMVFVETSVRRHRVTRDEIRAAMYADAETELSSYEMLAFENSGKGIIRKQEMLRNLEAGSILEVVEAEDVSEQEESIPGGGVGPYLSLSRNWSGPTRLLLLNEKYAGKQVSELPAALQAVYSRCGYLTSKSGLVNCRLTIFYEYWSMKEVLQDLLPAEVHAPVKFDRTGHVAELRLHPEHFPFRHLIAQVTVDKCKPTVRSVVVKREKLYDKQYAVHLELLAGTTSLVTTAWERDIPYKIDIASVIWDPRLSSERQRLINSFSKNDIVCDVCAGVGPVAIPASKKVRRVYANDVNPDAYFYLTRNVVENKVSGTVELAQLHTVLCSQRGGSRPGLVVDFCSKVFNEDIQAFLDKVFYIERPLPVTQLVMSHPFATVEFLEFFQGAFSRRTWPNASLPRIHLYSISGANDPKESFSKEISGALQTTNFEIATHVVAEMAHGEWMVSASFILPANFGFR